MALPIVLAALLASMLTTPARADEEPERRFLLSRGDENWAWLRNPHATRDFWDPIKYLRLSRARDDLFLSIGGETRQYLEVFQNEQWGSTGYVDNVAWLQRYMLHAELRLTRYFRLFAQLKSGIEVGRLGGPRPVDEDRLDANQAFVDVDAIAGRTLDDLSHLTIRVGRQEMSYGSGRLIDVRDGPVNVRLSYDAVRVISRFSVMRVDAFVARPDLTNRGLFDDGWDATQTFWGAWSTLDVARVLVDAYYLGLDRQHAVYEKGMGHELRHTIGGRIGVHAGRLLYLEVEGAYQLGRFLQGDISAWMVVFMGVLRLPLMLQPELTLGVGAASGDRNPASATLNTFNPLFPTGMYFGLMPANGSPNHIAPRLVLTLHASKTVLLQLEVFGFWRESLADGIYNVPGFLLRPGAGNPARYVGAQIEPYVMWNIDRHFSLNGSVGYFWTGDFFRQSQPAKNITYVATWASYKF